MKLQIAKQTLTEALQNVSRAVAAKSPLPALEGILLQAEQTELRLSGYDLDMGITTSVPADVAEPGAIVLTARLLVDIIRRLPADTVDLEADERNMTTIRCGRSAYSIMGIAAVEFPDMPKPDSSAVLSFPQHLLKNMIAQTRYAVATSDSMPVHRGSLFSLEDGVFHLVSVDGCRLALREEPYAVEEPARFIVPGKTLSDLEKILSDDEEAAPVSVYLSPKHIVFEVGSYRILTRLLEGNFLDYRNAIPKSAKTTVTVGTRPLIEAVERASLIIEDRLKNPLTCKFSDNSIQISAVTAMGHAEDSVDCAITGDPVEIGFNSGFLLEALKNADCDQVSIQLSGPLSPMKMLPAEGSHFTFLVLPVRIRS